MIESNPTEKLFFFKIAIKNILKARIAEELVHLKEVESQCITPHKTLLTKMAFVF